MGTEGVDDALPRRSREHDAAGRVPHEIDRGALAMLAGGEFIEHRVLGELASLAFARPGERAAVGLGDGRLVLGAKCPLDLGGHAVGIDAKAEQAATTCGEGVFFVRKAVVEDVVARGPAGLDLL